MDEQARGRVRVAQGHKRVRAYLGGEAVVDTSHPLLVWEIPYYPTYYVPAGDVAAKLTGTGERHHSPSRGDAEVCDVTVGHRSATGAALRYDESPVEAIAGTVRLEWGAMDEWLEEDEPVYTHPRDPFTRVDVLASSRRVTVSVDGVTVADSPRPHVLFETGLIPRWYLPLPDVRQDLLVPSATTSHCPYKGTASYFSLEIEGRRHEDLAWIYRTPLPESQKIAGLVCFYDERVDVAIDGVPQERPTTPRA
ncbi:MAG TPA: DUF427 domain-containing protein [Acidimicrobiales bacterium]|nr:DUF427 domain-containing protein [Acidimicrobiales bacterium]